MFYFLRLWEGSFGMDFLRSSNATTGGDGSRYYCDAGGCEDQYGGVIGKAVGNVAQAIRIDGDL